MERLSNGEAGEGGEEELKRQSIDKVTTMSCRFLFLSRQKLTIHCRILNLLYSLLLSLISCPFLALPDPLVQVDDLLAMLDREGGDSPSPEDEADGGLSIDEVWMASFHYSKLQSTAVMYGITVLPENL